MKTKIFQRLKNGICPKGLTHAFGQKMQFFFHYSFSLKIRVEERVNNVLKRKKTFFWTIKTKLFIVPKIAFFQRG